MSEVNPQGALLWSAVKAQCLKSGMMGDNPYVNVSEDGKIMVKCPRCGNIAEDKDYLVLSIMPSATLWSCPIRKCMAGSEGSRCGHLFSLVS